MKKILRFMGSTVCVLLITLLFASTCKTFVTAADKAAVSISVGNDEVKPGDSFTTDISLSNNPGITSMVLEVKYDSSVLTYVGDSWTYNDGVSCFTTDTGSSLKVSMSSKDVFKDNGSIVKLSFSVKADSTASGTLITLNSETENVICSTSSSQCSITIASKGIVGNKVVIVAPTAVPNSPATTQAPTMSPSAAPTQAVGAAGDSQSTSISLNNSALSNHTDDSSVQEDEDEKNDNSLEKSSSHSSSDKASSSSSSSKSAASSANSASDEDEIPKTGVVRWEFIFFSIGLISLLVGSIFVIKYVKTQKS